MLAFVDCRHARTEAIAMVRGPKLDWVTSILYERVEQLFGLPQPLGHLLYALCTDNGKPNPLPAFFDVIGEGADLAAVPLLFADGLLTRYALQFAEGDPAAESRVRMTIGVTRQRLDARDWNGAVPMDLQEVREWRTAVISGTCPPGLSARCAAACVMCGAGGIGAAAALLVMVSAAFGTADAMSQALRSDLCTLLQQASAAKP